MSNKKPVTLLDLSNQLGISINTVSKALRGLPGMSERTRAAIVKAAVQSGYRTKDQERSLVMERIPVIPHRQRHFKLIVPSWEKGWQMYQLLLEGLQEKLSEYGHLIETLLILDGLSEGSSFEEWADKHNLAYVDGIFIPPIPRMYERWLLTLPIPTVLLNFPPPSAEVDCVAWDVGSAIHKSVQYLLYKGHRNILYIGNHTEQRGYRMRWQSFVEAMKEANVDVTSENHVTGSFKLREEWIAQFVDKLEQMQPTALLYGLGGNVAWVYHVCSSLGKRIPEDLSLISFEDGSTDDMPELSRPYLLIRETGVRGAERMLWRLANPSLPYEHILLQGGFYNGKTVQKVGNPGP
jgi:LacI family transcriptional regulator